MNLHGIIQNSIELGTASALETLGISSGEISGRKARDTYGKWFLDAVRKGELMPCRVEEGKRGTKFYRVVDILALKVEQSARAELNENLYTIRYEKH